MAIDAPVRSWRGRLSRLGHFRDRLRDVFPDANESTTSGARQIPPAAAAGDRERGLIAAPEFAICDRYELEARCRALSSPVYLGDNTALCRVLGALKMYVDTTDTGFAANILLDGYWEMWLTMFFSRIVRPGMTIIDVGANYGYYTLLFGYLLNGSGHVFAIEPNPSVVEKLRRSVGLNGFARRTTVVPAAAGAIAGETALFVPRGEPKNAAVVEPHEEGTAIQGGAVYTVPRVAIDDCVAAAARIDVVKVDVEGAEQAAIDGMMRVLVRDKPVLVLEFNAARYRDPRSFVARLCAVYPRMRYVDYGGKAVPVATEELVGDRVGEDWLLCFDDPGAIGAT